MPTLAVGPCAQRVKTLEMMDQESVEPGALKKALGFLERVNSHLGGRRSVLAPLKKFLRKIPEETQVSFLDVGCGGGDISRAVVLLSRSYGLRPSVLAIDSHPQVAALAKTACKDWPEIQVLEGNVLALPLQSVDFVFASLVLHHQDDPVPFVCRLDHLARQGLVISDLLRDIRAYWWVKLLSFRQDPMVQWDGPLSVQKAFTPQEVKLLIRQTHTEYLSFQKVFGYRFVISGVKGASHG